MCAFIPGVRCNCPQPTQPGRQCTDYLTTNCGDGGAPATPVTPTVTPLSPNTPVPVNCVGTCIWVANKDGEDWVWNLSPFSTCRNQNEDFGFGAVSACQCPAPPNPPSGGEANTTTVCGPLATSPAAFAMTALETPKEMPPAKFAYYECHGANGDGFGNWLLMKNDCEYGKEPERPNVPCKAGQALLLMCKGQEEHVKQYMQMHNPGMNVDLFANHTQFYIIRSKLNRYLVVSMDEKPQSNYIAGPFANYEDAEQALTKIMVHKNPENPRPVANFVSSRLPSLEDTMIENLKKKQPKIETSSLNTESLDHQVKAIEQKKVETIEEVNSVQELEYKNPVDIANEAMKQQNQIKIVPNDANIQINKEELLE